MFRWIFFSSALSSIGGICSAAQALPPCFNDPQFHSQSLIPDTTHGHYYSSYDTFWAQDRLAINDMVAECIQNTIDFSLKLPPEQIDIKMADMQAHIDQTMVTVCSRLNHFKSCSLGDIYGWREHSSHNDALFFDFVNGRFLFALLTKGIKPNGEQGFVLKNEAYYRDELTALLVAWKLVQEGVDDGHAMVNQKVNAMILKGSDLLAVEKEMEQYEKPLGIAALEQLASKFMAEAPDLKKHIVDTELSPEFVNSIQSQLNETVQLQESGKYVDAGKKLTVIEGKLNQSKLPTFARGYFAKELAAARAKQKALISSAQNKKAIAVASGISALLATYLVDRAGRKYKHLSDEELKKLTWYRRYPVAFIRSLGIHRHTATK